MVALSLLGWLKCKPRIMREKKFKKLFYGLLHVNYLAGVLYALIHFLMVPRRIYISRRLWAYETWIVLSFWGIFTSVQFIEQEKGSFLKKARQIIITKLILLVFPWGLFLLLSPKGMMDFFGLSSAYWRILGGASLVGVLVYYYPYHFWKQKFARVVLAFGFFDNLLAALVISFLFLTKRVPFVVLGSVPLLLYFSVFFLNLFRYHRKSVKG